MDVGTFLIVLGLSALVGIGGYYYLSGEEEVEDIPKTPPDNGEPVERPGPSNPIEKEPPVSEDLTEPLPIEEMNIGGRTLSILQREGFETREDLLHQGDFTEIKGIGKSRSEDIEQAIIDSYEE